MISKYDVGQEVYVKCNIAELNCSKPTGPFIYRVKSFLSNNIKSDMWIGEDMIFSPEEIKKGDINEHKV